MNKRTKVLLIVAALAVAVYLGYRYLKGRQDGGGEGETSPEGLGSNLNSPAPLDAFNAAPSVGPAVSIPLSVTITHSDQKSEVEGAANPYHNMIGARPISSPLGMRRPAQPGNIYNPEDLDLGKSEDSAYATTHETG